MKKLEYSQIVRKKLKELRANLTLRFGEQVSQKSIKKITNAARSLRELEEQGKCVSSMFDVDCDYRCLFVSHNYLFYRIEKDKVIIVEMFDEREDFMQKLFGISTIDQESIDCWNE